MHHRGGAWQRRRGLLAGYGASRVRVGLVCGCSKQRLLVVLLFLLLLVLLFLLLVLTLHITLPIAFALATRLGLRLVLLIRQLRPARNTPVTLPEPAQPAAPRSVRQGAPWQIRPGADTGGLLRLRPRKTPGIPRRRRRRLAASTQPTHGARWHGHSLRHSR